MEDFMAAAVQTVGAAAVQEAMGRAVSLVLGRRKEKASRGQYLERFMKAVKEVEFVLERTAKLPITEVSLLRDRIELKRDFIQASCLLNRNKKRKTPQGQQEISQAVWRSSSRHGWVTHPAMFSVSSFIGMMNKDELCLSHDDVERFEQFADSARNILRRVESGCSLRRYMFFPSPLVRHVLDERKILCNETVQAYQERYLLVCPGRLEEERGVEALVRYKYLDHKRPEKSFSIRLVLRLSESTDIVGVAMNCLQSLASQFKFVADTAMGELTLLANLQEVSHSHAPPWVGIEESHNEMIHRCRPDPLCCKAKGHGSCANNVVSSELSNVFPEEVVFFYFKCYISAPEYSLRGSADEAGKRSIKRNRRPPLELTIWLAPHYVHGERQPESYAVEEFEDNGEKYIDVSIQQVGEMVRSRAINCFLRQPKATKYSIGWVTKHGAACFYVEKLRAAKGNSSMEEVQSAKVVEVDIDKEGRRQ